MRRAILKLYDTQRGQRAGVGDSVRWRAQPWLAVKASYEWATRLPSVDEIFGDGAQLEANLALEPETSHNINLEALVETETRVGPIAAQVDAFARDAHDLIQPIGSDRRFTYQNVVHARILGVEGSGRWTAPGGWAWLEGSLTLQDLRNASTDGPFAAYEGDRLPNRPWLLGALGASARTRDLLLRDDELAVFENSRYVHAFDRGWQSLGTAASKQVIPSQLVHGIGATYALRGPRVYTATFEIQNVTDEVARDSWGVVKPGRAYYAKLGVEL